MYVNLFIEFLYNTISFFFLFFARKISYNIGSFSIVFEQMLRKTMHSQQYNIHCIGILMRCVSCDYLRFTKTYNLAEKLSLNIYHGDVLETQILTAPVRSECFEQYRNNMQIKRSLYLRCVQNKRKTTVETINNHLTRVRARSELSRMLKPICRNGFRK